MIRFNLILVFILLSDLFCATNAQNDNSCQDFGKCVNKLKDLTNDENMTFAHREEHLEELCGKLKEAVDCVNAHIRRCLDMSSRVQYEAMTNGTQKLIKDLCTKDSDFRNVYLAHAQCFHTHQKELQICTETYYSDFDKIEKELEPETQTRTWCCNFDFHRLCTYNSVLEKCGEAAALLAQQIVITGGGILVNDHCSNYTHKSPFCSSGRTHHSHQYSSHLTIFIVLFFMFF